MNKLIVNHLEKIFVTSDCATMVREFEVMHPAAKMLVLAAEMQEQEFGDNTNFTLSFAGEILKHAEGLLRNGIHASEIVSGYKRAHDKVIEMLPSLVVRTLTTDDLRNEQVIARSIKAVLATKQYGYEDFLSTLVAKAAIMVMNPSPSKPRVSVDSIRVVKLKGGGVTDSTVMKGMVLQRDAEGTIKRVVNAKVAVFGCGLEASGTETKATVLIRNAEELMNYNKSEEAKMEEVVKAIHDSGVNVVVVNGTIAEMAHHFLERYGIMAIKCTSKWDTRRICTALGATAVVRLGAISPEEMGSCALVEVRDVSGRLVTVFEQDDNSDVGRIATILIRASTENVLNDLERSVDDGIHAAKTLCNDPNLLAGAGAVELEIAHKLRQFADTVTGLDQYGIRKYADAFEVVPRTLAENSGADATVAVAALNAAHVQGRSNAGFDVENHGEINAADASIYDLVSCKTNALWLATDAAITVLRVDQIVMSKPAGGPKPRDGGADPDD